MTVTLITEFDEHGEKTVKIAKRMNRKDDGRIELLTVMNQMKLNTENLFDIELSTTYKFT